VIFSEIKLEQLKPDPPTWDSVYFMAPRKPSAVAIVFFINECNETNVLFIRRSTSVSSHRGQIGFPGGRLEVGDQRPRDTALREAQEEVGLDLKRVRVLGGIEPLPALDGTLVFPIVAVTDTPVPELRLNSAEVAEIYMIPVELVLESNRREFSFNMFGFWRKSYLYDCGPISVWGLSAEILRLAKFQVLTQ
jgi:8-oxo-dGTP pyrophosphatase MutT (NUDIX family)